MPRLSPQPMVGATRLEDGMAIDVRKLARVIDRLDCIVGDGEEPTGVRLGLDYGTAEEWAEAITALYHAPDSLRAAWAEAEATLPDLTHLRVEGKPGNYLAAEIDYAGHDWHRYVAPTPEAALRGLTAMLRER